MRGFLGFGTAGSVTSRVGAERAPFPENGPLPKWTLCNGVVFTEDQQLPVCPFLEN
jgi:hypothetical protein